MKRFIFLSSFFLLSGFLNGVIGQINRQVVKGTIVNQETQEPLIMQTATFSQQHKAYFRLDAKVTYKVQGPKIMHEIYINVDNILNTKNVFTQYFSPTTLTLETIAQPGRFPSFNYGVRF